MRAGDTFAFLVLSMVPGLAMEDLPKYLNTFIFRINECLMAEQWRRNEERR